MVSVSHLAGLTVDHVGRQLVSWVYVLSIGTGINATNPKGKANPKDSEGG